MGFSAYAIAGDVDDPMVKAVHGLIDNAAKHEEKIQAIMEVLEKSDSVRLSNSDIKKLIAHEKKNNS